MSTVARPYLASPPAQQPPLAPRHRPEPLFHEYHRHRQAQEEHYAMHAPPPSIGGPPSREPPRTASTARRPSRPSPILGPQPFDASRPESLTSKPPLRSMSTHRNPLQPADVLNNPSRGNPFENRHYVQPDWAGAAPVIGQPTSSREVHRPSGGDFENKSPQAGPAPPLYDHPPAIDEVGDVITDAPALKETVGGNRIEDYEIGKLLGRGGFGYVYQARSKLPQTADRTFAIKMIDKKLMRAANMTSRVANEVEIHWQLKHPSILKLYNYFEDVNYVYLVMEVCKNGELYRYIQGRKKPLTEAEARHIMSQVVRGLMYLHSHGIIHRDLKLSNLLLTADWDVKIADFGLAVKIAEGEEQKTMCGTPNYISPEIVSRQPYGLASDIWSLGCMMFTCLTGRPPFESQALKKTLEKVAQGEYHLPDHLSEQAKDIIRRLLQKDPDDRLPLAKVLQHPFFKNKEEPPAIAAPVPKALTPEEIQVDATVPPEAYLADPGASDMSFLDTTRLKPMVHKTKHGQIEIRENHQLVVDFDADKYVTVIDPKGDIVRFHRRPGAGETIDTAKLLQLYRTEKLPPKYVKKYTYAKKFVHLVRSKTPKIVFYSPQAKCNYMEDGNTMDIVFYAGTRLQMHLSSGDLRISSSQPQKAAEPPKKFTFDPTTLSCPLPTEWHDVWRHAKECLRQCQQVDKQSEQNTKWPLILKSSSCSANAMQTANKIQEEGEPDVAVSQAPASQFDAQSALGTLLPPTASVSPHTHPRRPHGLAPYYPAGPTGPVSARAARSAAGSANFQTQLMLAQQRPSLMTKESPTRAIEGKAPFPPSMEVSPQKAEMPEKSEGLAPSVVHEASSTTNTAAWRGATQGASQPSTMGHTLLNDVPAVESRSVAGPMDLKPNGIETPTVRSAHGSAVGSAPPSQMGMPTKRSTANWNGSKVLSTVAGSAASNALLNLRFRFLPDVGWCLQPTDGRFHVCFLDGTRMKVEAKGCWVEWFPRPDDTETPGQRFTIDKHLPADVKAKLATLPRFVALFQPPPSSNSAVAAPQAPPK